MTSDTAAAPLHAADLGRLLLLPAAAGVLLAVVDLELMLHASPAWANLANSSALWATAAFALAAVLRTDPVRGAVAGTVLLVVAVEAYYAYATVVEVGGLASAVSRHALMWMAFGVVAGAAFGVAGAWSRSRVWWQQVVGTALGAGILLGEALHVLMNLDMAHGMFHGELEKTAGLMALLGVAVLVLAGGRPVVIGPAAVATVPCAVFTAFAFSAFGIAY